MGSQFKKAHRTYALAQPAGERYPTAVSSRVAARSPLATDALVLNSELCEHVPKAAERAELLGVSIALEQAWQEGRALPLLRAHRKAPRAAVRTGRGGAKGAED
jgi:hypothetical protein